MSAGMEGIGEVVEVKRESLVVGTFTLLAEPLGAWSTEKVTTTNELVSVLNVDIDQLPLLAVNHGNGLFASNAICQPQRRKMDCSVCREFCYGSLLVLSTKSRHLC